MEEVEPASKFTDFAKARIVLEALMIGIPVEMNLNGSPRQVKLMQGIPVIECTKTNTKTNVTVNDVLGIDDFMTLSNFIKICTKMDDEKIIMIGATTVLNKQNKHAELVKAYVK